MNPVRMNSEELKKAIQRYGIRCDGRRYCEENGLDAGAAEEEKRADDILAIIFQAIDDNYDNSNTVTTGDLTMFGHKQESK